MATRTAPQRLARSGDADHDGQRRAGGGRVHEARVSPPSRRVRLPELAVGVLVTVGFALAAVLWQLGSTERVPALAVSQPVARGETVTSADVRVVYVTAGDDVARLDESEAGSVVGRVALVDLTPGVLWSPSFVASTVTAGDGDGVVGLALDAGQFPAGLIAGDVVNVLTPATSSGDGQVVRGVVVSAVAPAGADGRVLVSLTAPLADAEQIAALSAAGAGAVRVVQVGR